MPRNPRGGAAAGNGMAGLRERPILIYHQIGDYPPERLGDYGITKDAFRAHLDRLGEMGLEVIPLERMIAQMKGEASFRPRAVSLTFDRGFRDGRKRSCPFWPSEGIRRRSSSRPTLSGRRTPSSAPLFPAWTGGRFAS